MQYSTGISFRSIILMAFLGLLNSSVYAERISDISNTKHNLSTSSPGSVSAVSESQICVFCHTPHQAEAIPKSAIVESEGIRGHIHALYI